MIVPWDTILFVPWDASQVDKVKEGGKLRSVAKDFGLKKSTLHRYVKDVLGNSVANIKFTPNYAVKKVFTDEEERLLLEYIVKAAKINYGLTAKQACVLAYQFAVGRKLNNIPEAWLRDGMAGRQWLFRYRSKFPELSLRKPEATWQQAWHVQFASIRSMSKSLRQLEMSLSIAQICSWKHL